MAEETRIYLAVSEDTQGRIIIIIIMYYSSTLHCFVVDDKNRV